jgi:hypothetical protein
MIDQPPESRFAGLLKPFFDSIDPEQTSPRRQLRIPVAVRGYPAWLDQKSSTHVTNQDV